MAFWNRDKQSKEFVNPRAAQRQQGASGTSHTPGDSIWEEDLVARPADAPVEDTPAAPSTPNPTPTGEAAAPTNLFLSLDPDGKPWSTWDGHGTIVLWQSPETDAPPVPVEHLIAPTMSLPPAMRAKLLDPDHFFETEHYVYYMDIGENGEMQILEDEPPEAICADIIKRHNARVADYLAEVTGLQKPAAPAPAKQLKDMSDAELREQFESLPSIKDLRRVLDIAHAVLRERRSANGEDAGHDDGHHGQPKADPKAEPKSQPKAEPKPAPQPKQPSTSDRFTRYAGL